MMHHPSSTPASSRRPAERRGLFHCNCRVARMGSARETSRPSARPGSARWGRPTCRSWRARRGPRRLRPQRRERQTDPATQQQHVDETLTVLLQQVIKAQLRPRLCPERDDRQRSVGRGARARPCRAVHLARPVISVRSNGRASAQQQSRPKPNVVSLTCTSPQSRRTPRCPRNPRRRSQHGRGRSA